MSFLDWLGGPVGIATWGAPLLVLVLGSVFTRAANNRNRAGKPVDAAQESHDLMMTGASDYIVHLEASLEERSQQLAACQLRINSLERRLGRAEGRARRKKAAT